MVIPSSHKLTGVKKCECGCGQDCSLFTKRGKRRRFIKNHDKRITQRGRKHTAETKQKLSLMRKGDKCYWYGKKRDLETRQKISQTLSKGGSQSSEGYVLQYALYEDKNHKQLKAHRLIYEKYYNCCLLPWIDIHHINGDKTDNMIENLEPIHHIIHAVQHRRKI